MILFEHHIPSMLICCGCVGRGKCGISSMSTETLWFLQFLPLSVWGSGYTWITLVAGCVTYALNYSIVHIFQSRLLGSLIHATNQKTSQGLLFRVHWFIICCFKSKEKLVEIFYYVAFPNEILLSHSRYKYFVNCRWISLSQYKNASGVWLKTYAGYEFRILCLIILSESSLILWLPHEFEALHVAGC